ncbi:MAG: 50S ribosomal protein L18 [Parachlamydiales bacterium]|jgi:large subunit ribosomal protein L18
MEKNLLKRKATRNRRSCRVRNCLHGQYRLYVHKTNRHLSAQLIDDEAGLTLVSVSTLSKVFAKDEKRKSKASAEKLGAMIAKLALEKQVEKVVFDRGRFKYHGLIALVADAARKAGLKF